MDPSKCLEILHARNIIVDPEKDQLYRSSFPTPDESIPVSVPCSEAELFSKISTIDLMNLFTTLQGERVQVLLLPNPLLAAIFH